MQWTSDVTKALGLTKERGDKKALKSLKKKQVCLVTYGLVKCLGALGTSVLGRHSHPPTVTINFW